MSIYTKTGEKIVDFTIDRECYFDAELVQIWATLEGDSTKRLLYISDLREDQKGEIKDVVRASLKGAKRS